MDGRGATGSASGIGWDETQSTLDIAGFLPVIGSFADLLNGIISAARGNKTDAAINLFGAVPGIGDVAKAAKMVAKAADAAKLADKAKGASKLTDKDIITGKWTPPAGKSPFGDTPIVPPQPPKPPAPPGPGGGGRFTGYDGDGGRFDQDDLGWYEWNNN